MWSLRILYRCLSLLKLLRQLFLGASAFGENPVFATCLYTIGGSDSSIISLALFSYSLPSLAPSLACPSSPSFFFATNLEVDSLYRKYIYTYIYLFIIHECLSHFGPCRKHSYADRIKPMFLPVNGHCLMALRFARWGATDNLCGRHYWWGKQNRAFCEIVVCKACCKCCEPSKSCFYDSSAEQHDERFVRSTHDQCQQNAC